MVNSKDTEKKLLKKFLREQRLTRSFNRFKKIKRKTTLTLEVDGVRKNLVVYRRDNKTIIADGKTFKPISTTKKFNTKNIQSGFEKKEITFKRKGRTGTKLITALRFGEISRTPLKNFDSVSRITPLRKKVGKTVINVTFFKGKRRMTVTGFSASPKDLTDKKSKELSFDEAWKSALHQSGFSYENFRINWIHYDYFIIRRR